MTKARDLANASTALSAVSATELAFVDGVTSAIQTQMDAKAPSSTAVTLTGTQTLTNKTLTNPVIASVINNTLTSTTGDIIYASAANTPARLGIGSSAQVLTVASGVPSWATPASGSTLNFTSLSSGTPSGNSYTVSVASYNYYVIMIDGVGASSGLAAFYLRLNGDSTSKYCQSGFDGEYTGTVGRNNASFNGRTFFEVVEGGNTANIDSYAILQISGGASSGIKLIQSAGAPMGNQGDIMVTNGIYTGTSAITSITLYEGNGFTWTTGTVRIYGSN